MQLTVERTVASRVAPSPRVCRVAAMFGLGLDDARQLTVIPPTTLDLEPGQILFITGPSGGGKSTLLRLIAQAARDADPPARVIDFQDLPPLPDRPLVDCFGEAPLETVLETLSRAGLNDAFVMLRNPAQLSDGQRYRLRLAQSFMLAREAASAPVVILADEFGAALDRVTAKVIARNVRRWVTRAEVCFVCATTHDDLLDALEPDVVIEKDLGARLETAERREDDDA